MDVKDRVSVEYMKSLSSSEILFTFIYCKKLIEREAFLFKEEFDDINFFFFDGDENLTVEVLTTIKNMYYKEYILRRLN